MPYREPETTDTTSPRDSSRGQVAFRQHYQAQAANTDHDADGAADGPLDHGARAKAGLRHRQVAVSQLNEADERVGLACGTPELADLRATTRAAGTALSRSYSAI